MLWKWVEDPPGQPPRWGSGVGTGLPTHEFSCQVSGTRPHSDRTANELAPPVATLQMGPWVANNQPCLLHTKHCQDTDCEDGGLRDAHFPPHSASTVHLCTEL